MGFVVTIQVHSYQDNKMKLTRNISLTLLLLATFIACAPMQNTPPLEPINWRTLAQGKPEAATKGMPVLVDFYFGEGCHRCMVFDNRIYSNNQVIEKIRQNFIPVRVDLTQDLSADEQQLEDKLLTGGECMLAFLNSAGNIVKDTTGKKICSMEMISRQEFMKYLDQALENLK